MSEPLRRTLEEWESTWERLMMRIFVFISPVVLPGLAYAIVRIVVEFAARGHWALGLTTAVVVAVLIVYLSLGLSKKFFEKFPATVVITMFGIIVAAATPAFAGISYFLMHQQIAVYEIRADYSIGTFADYYAWIFIDMLPALDVWETLGISSPATPQNFVARLPVLAFRLFVVLGILPSWNTWKKHRDASKSEST
jgi:hypothetical protein